jgi:hypothetical protein
VERIKDNDKMVWESDYEYNYRLDTYIIIVNVSKVLRELEVLNKNSEYDCRYLNENMKKELNKLKNLTVPELYTNVQRFLINCLQCYELALNYLVKGIKNKDAKITYKSGRYIHEGNSWMVIAKTRIWEAVEAKIEEINKHQGIKEVLDADITNYDKKGNKI